MGASVVRKTVAHGTTHSEISRRRTIYEKNTLEVTILRQVQVWCTTVRVEQTCAHSGDDDS